jgi:alanyl-tRNA synthetase
VSSIQFLEQKSGIKYTFGDTQSDIAMRVIADHIRAIAFCVADGQLPSNNGAGYVIRRILRRAVRYGFQFLNFKEPILEQLCLLIAANFKTVFPELDAQVQFVSKVIREEELSFLRTLENGLKRLDQLMASLKPGEVIDGKIVFELNDTFGFPVDLTSLIARENGFGIDEIGYKAALEEQKTRSRKATELNTDDWQIIAPEESTVFIGYDVLESPVQILKYRKVKAKGKELFQLVFNTTPFYPEGGGQVGDKGIISNENETVQILNTLKENNLIIHLTEQLPSDPSKEFRAIVNKNNRTNSENNHSATHLLHAALKQVLGKHIAQKGSLVNADYLRFDFSHFAAMTSEEINAVEKIVNQKIRENIALNEQRNIPITAAEQMGATMLFGEKYGETVRVITFDASYSMELCGGTHVKQTGQIGLFKISSESAVAAGVRRIEAVTAAAAELYVKDIETTLHAVQSVLKGKDLLKSIEQVLAEKSELQKKIEQLEQFQIQQIKANLKLELEPINGINSLISQLELNSVEQLKNLSFQLKNEIPNLFFMAAALISGKPFLSIIIDESLVKEKGLHAGKFIKELAPLIKGGGGGQDFYATAGGSDTNGLVAACDAMIVKLKS